MQFPLSALALALAAGLLVAACGGGAVAPLQPAQAPLSGAQPPAAILPAVPVLAPGREVLDRTLHSGVTAQRTAVAKDEAAFAALWAQHGAAKNVPKVDFANDMVVGVFLGERPNACNAAHIVGTEYTAQKIVVRYAEYAPGAPDPSLLTCAAAAPAELAAIPRSDLPVEFQKVDTPRAVETVELSRTTQSGIADAMRAVLTSQSGFEELWRAHAGGKVPAVDFAKQSVVAVFAGAAAEGCAEVQIDRVYEDGGRVVVEYRQGNLAGMAMCTKEVRAPAHLVAVPRVQKPYVFIRQPLEGKPADAAPGGQTGVKGGTDGGVLVDHSGALVWEVLERAENSRIQGGAQLAIDDADAWARFWASHHPAADDAPALPKVDFAKYRVLAIVKEGGGCAHIEIDGIAGDAGKLTVSWSEHVLQTFAACPAVTVNRSLIALVPRTAAKVEFVEGERR